MYHYFDEYCREAGIDFEQFLALGRQQRRRSRRAVLHGGAGAQDLGLPQRRQPPAPRRLAGDVAGPVAEAAGVGSADHLRHQRRPLPSWINGDLAELYDQYLQPDWRERCNDPEDLGAGRRYSGRGTVGSAPPPQAPPDRLRPRTRRRAAAARRKRSAAEVRRADEVLDPEALTIGFARRFATYKRATLLFRDVERLQTILLQSRHARCRSSSPARPIRKDHARQDAHPRDRAAFARSASSGSTSSSSKTTT